MARVQIKFDSATTKQVRDLAQALHRAGLTSELKVGLDGPEKWNGETPKMTTNQFAQVAARIIKKDGQLLSDLFDLDKEGT